MRRSRDERRGPCCGHELRAGGQGHRTGEKTPPRESWLRQHRAIQSRLAEALKGGVLEHEPPLVAVLEPYGDDAARFDARDDPGAERLVANGVPRREIGDVLARRELALHG